MRTSNQPAANTNSQDRDAAIQIITDLQLSGRSAKIFERLEQGKEITDKEAADVREHLSAFLTTIRERLFAETTEEHRAWVRRQQAYTERILAALTRRHFSNLNAEETVASRPIP